MVYFLKNAKIAKTVQLHNCNRFEFRDYFWEKHMGEDDVLFTNHLVGK